MESTMTNLLKLVEYTGTLCGKIPVPEYNINQKFAWISGRTQGAIKVRNIIRHSPSEKLPFLTQEPEEITNEYGKNAKYWLEGYNAVVTYVEKRINSLIFIGTFGQTLKSLI